MRHFLSPSGHVSPLRGQGSRGRFGDDDGRVSPPRGLSAYQLHPQVLHTVEVQIPGVASHGGGSTADLQGTTANMNRTF